MGKLFSRAKMGSSAFSHVLAPLADCISSHTYPSGTCNMLLFQLAATLVYENGMCTEVAKQEDSL